MVNAYNLMKKHGSIADILTFTTFKPDSGFVDRYDAAAAVFMHKHDASAMGEASDVSEPTTTPTAAPDTAATTPLVGC